MIFPTVLRKVLSDDEPDEHTFPVYNVYIVRPNYLLLIPALRLYVDDALYTPAARGAWYDQRCFIAVTFFLFFFSVFLFLPLRRPDGVNAYVASP